MTLADSLTEIQRIAERDANARTVLAIAAVLAVLLLAGLVYLEWREHRGGSDDG